jgi:hypothetical protein
LSFQFLEKRNKFNVINSRLLVPTEVILSKMVFGMKKKDKEMTTPSPDEETPVDVGDYGMEPASDDDDEASSIPPPPPGVKSASEMFRDEEGSEATAPPPADEPEGQNVSFLTEHSAGDKNMKDPNRRKKLLLILAAIATFCIFLGLTISYARKDKGESSSASSVSNLDRDETFFETGSNKVPIEDGTDEPDTITSTVAPTDGDTEDNTATDAPTDRDTEDGTATDAPTDGDSEEVTDAGTEENSTFNDPNGPGGLDCVKDQMFASSSCEGGTTTATISMCVTNEIDDQFWAWIETPIQYQASARNDWDWLSNGMTVDKVGIPPGYYEIGLYANGDSRLSEYPLITSTSFTIVCA